MTSLKEHIENKEQESAKQKKYQAYFNKILNKYGVKSPNELDEETKKKFFDEIDKGWEGENEED